MLRNRFWKTRLTVLFALACCATAARAQLAARKASEWIGTLESPQRVGGQKVDEVLARLSPRNGMVVADIGAGSGLFTRPLAKAVAPSGTVYAVDIQQDLLDYINKRDKEEGVKNVQT